jgi:hypothetical protein
LLVVKVLLPCPFQNENTSQFVSDWYLTDSALSRRAASLPFFFVFEMADWKSGILGKLPDSFR